MADLLDLEAVLAAAPPIMVLRAVERNRLSFFIVEYANRATIALLDRDEEEIVGFPFSHILSDGHQTGVLQRLADAYHSETLLDLRLSLIGADTEIPVIADCGYTDQKNQIMALYLRPLLGDFYGSLSGRIIEAASHGEIDQFQYWLRLNTTGSFELGGADPRLAQRLGVSTEELLQEGIQGFLEPGARRRFVRRIGQLMAGEGDTLHYRLQGRTGQSFSVVDYSAPVFVEDHPRPVAFLSNLHLLHHNADLEAAKQSAISLAEWLVDFGYALILSNAAGEVLQSSQLPLTTEFRHVDQAFSRQELFVWEAHCDASRRRGRLERFHSELVFDERHYACQLTVLPQIAGYFLTLVEFQDFNAEADGVDPGLDGAQLTVVDGVSREEPKPRTKQPPRPKQAIFWIDRRGIILDFDEDAAAVFAAVEPAIGDTIQEILSDRIHSRFLTNAFRTLEQGARSVSLITIKLLGLSFWRLSIRVTAATKSSADAGSRFEIAVVARRYRGPPIISSGIEEFRKFANSIAVGVAELDERLRFVWCNDRVAELLQLDGPSLVGRSCRAFLSPSPTTKLTVAEVFDQSLKDRIARRELLVRRQDGALVPVEISLTWLNMRGRTQFVLTLHDITLLRHSEETIKNLAYYDGLTGLPNRVLFHERLSHAIDRAEREKETLTLMLLDLSRFGLINESLGLEQGDQLLRGVGERLRATLRQSDTVARLGADEFIILLHGVASTDAAVNVASKLLSCFDRPFRLNGHEISIKVNLGITIYPNDADNGDLLIRNANSALVSAKEQGAGRYNFYTSDMNDVAFERLILEGNIRRAIAERQFELHYQPQIAIDDGQIVGFEALLRWFHPDHGQISPGQFIPLAEDTGLIRELGKLALENACKDLRRWQDAGHGDLRIAVNVSGRQIQDRHFPEVVSNALTRYAIDAKKLELEITESIMLDAAANQFGTIEKLKEIGVSISIDDFGTGYSSFRYIQEFPVHCLKIDRSLVATFDVVGDEESRRSGVAIARAIATLGQGLQIRIVAEGIETEDQFDTVKQLGCDEAQGFLFSRPVPFNRATHLLEDGMRRDLA